MVFQTTHENHSNENKRKHDQKICYVKNKVRKANSHKLTLIGLIHMTVEWNATFFRAKISFNWLVQWLKWITVIIAPFYFFHPFSCHFVGGYYLAVMFFFLPRAPFVFRQIYLINIFRKWKRNHDKEWHSCIFIERFLIHHTLNYLFDENLIRKSG